MGRAGRDGKPATAVLFVPPRTNSKNTVGEDLQNIMASKDTCIRFQFLHILKMADITEKAIWEVCKGENYCSVCRNEAIQKAQKGSSESAMVVSDECCVELMGTLGL